MVKLTFFIMGYLLLSTNTYAIDDFTHESEFSSVTSRGNSPYENYLTKTNNRIIFDKMHDITFGGHYSYGSINDEQIEVVRNWDINAKYLTAVSKRTYAFLGAVVEGDEFAGYSERNNIDLGFNTKFINRDKFKIFTEFGYRQTVEVPIDGKGPYKDQKLRFFANIEDSLSFNTSYGFWVEYIPNLTRTKDYMISFEPSFRVMINKIFSMKVSYKGMYDNLPAIEARKKYDQLYTTSLLAKF